MMAPTIVTFIIYFVVLLCIGLIGIGMFKTLPGGDRERVFICMINEVIHPWAAGIMLSALIGLVTGTAVLIV
jgi:Na+/proline symporter